MSMNVWVKSGRVFNLTPNGGITTATPTYGTAVYKDSPYASFQAIVTGTGAVTATVIVQASNEEATYNGTNSNWITISTIPFWHNYCYGWCNYCCSLEVYSCWCNGYLRY